MCGGVWIDPQLWVWVEGGGGGGGGGEGERPGGIGTEGVGANYEGELHELSG